MMPFSRIAALVFAVVCVGHALRLGFHCVVTVDGYTVPMWISVLGVMATGTLSIMLWRESKSR